MSEQCLIVGAGPVGLMMGCLLSKYGVSYRIIEQNPQPVQQTKAAGLWARSLEAFHHVGLAERFLEVSHRSYSAHIFQGGQERVHLDMSKLASFYNFITLLPQHHTEALLIEHLREVHGVEVERGQRLLTIDAGRANWEAVDGSGAGGGEFRYIFGCDGAHSRVRKQIGATFEGGQIPGDWMVGDILVESEKLAQDEVSIFVGAQGPIALFALGAKRYRIVALGHEPLDPVPLDFFMEAARDRIPFPVTLSDGQFLTRFSIHERQADKYDNGTCFLLGDAAHIHSPAGGQGLNTGLQDAFNLAWKVSQVILWGSSPRLLESYQAERHPVARRVIEASGFAIRAVSLTNPIARTVQSAAMSLAGSLEPVQARIRNMLSELDIVYEESPLNIGSSCKSLRPGDRVPEVMWRDDKSHSFRLHDLFTDLRWTLISSGNHAPLPGLDPTRLRQVRVARLGRSGDDFFSDPTGAVVEACGLEKGSHLLVRPDGYAAGYFNQGEEAMMRGLRPLLGAV